MPSTSPFRIVFVASMLMASTALVTGCDRNESDMPKPTTRSGEGTNDTTRGLTTNPGTPLPPLQAPMTPGAPANNGVGGSGTTGSGAR